MSAALVVGIEGLPDAVVAVGAGATDPAVGWELFGFEKLERRAARSAGGGMAGGAGADGVGAGGATEGGFIRPAFVRAANRSLPDCGLGAAAAWFWMLWSWECGAFSNEGAASRI